MKPHKHAALIHAWADGVIIQGRLGNGGWEDLKQPNWECVRSGAFRIKPEAPKLKLIDWSKMPRGAMTSRGFLLKQAREQAYIEEYGYEYHSDLRLVEQPNFQYWGGGECPVPEGVMVKVVMRDGKCARENVSLFRWEHRGLSSQKHEGDIIAYRIIGLAEGWTDHEDAV